MPTYTFTNPDTGETVLAQNNRLGMDYGDFNGTQNAAYDGRLWRDIGSFCCGIERMRIPGEIGGDELCAATNGLNREEFDANTTQLNFTIS